MSIEVFFSYSHRDEELRDEMAKHLTILKRQGVITTWHDREITAGTEWAGAIDAHMNSAQVILLLISPDFLASDYCWDIELKRAMERHEAREARVIPVILRPVDNWSKAPFGKLQAFPTNGKPVTTWSNRDEAFANVAQAIRKAVQELAATKPEPSSAPVSAPVVAQESTGLTPTQRRRLEEKLKELQEQYDFLNKKIQHLRKSKNISDLSPDQILRVEGQIEVAQAEREQLSEQMKDLENRLQ
jgi:hypothetical protein